MCPLWYHSLVVFLLRFHEEAKKGDELENAAQKKKDMQDKLAGDDKALQAAIATSQESVGFFDPFC